MSSTFQRLDFDRDGAAEAEAVRILADIVRTSMEPNTYPYSAQFADELTAKRWDSAFGLSPEFTRWEARFTKHGGVWKLSDDGFFEARY